MDLKTRVKLELKGFKLLLKAVPSVVLILFVLSVFSMNLLANKSINLPFEWLALDCGIIVSWVSFLSMDMITKHFGPKAATQISVFALLMNLFMCGVFFVGSSIPGTWAESYTEGHEAAVNLALDNTFGGVWYVLFGSSLAFLISALVNNYTNWGIGKALRKGEDGFFSYALRSYASTALGQFIDNLTFALVVSHSFFGWSMVQCLTCAFTGMIAELICEAVFSGLGYKTCKAWKEQGVGQEYFEFMTSLKGEA